ncbi:hypothetical protein GO013_16040 [Pseudodesulfovibrio sp. JC047]|uniref:hypothetical protein n=1 Tax=Pseudodesulfovibrio sp. JC047 TaxID=2683199 RepID=UPI0013D00C23|nr:hypothetical protein [Pseudodesulfovibrio sp. JC047]NDV20922.1 hypothetical protein [Pseudodesulfovibrio sp. JC047]
MSLETLRTGIVGSIDAVTPDSVTCDSHGGRFDEKELRRISAKAPAAFVAMLGFSDLKASGGDYEAVVSWGIFVVAKDIPKVSRDLVALSVVDVLARHVAGNTWGMDDVLGVPVGVRADNLFAASIDKIGVAMWAVTWRQHMRIGQAMPDDVLATLDLFSTFDAKFPVGADVPTAEDKVSLPQDGA